MSEKTKWELWTEQQLEILESMSVAPPEWLETREDVNRWFTWAMFVYVAKENYRMNQMLKKIIDGFCLES